MPDSEREGWLGIADKLHDLAVAILDSKIVLDAKPLEEDPKYIALALLARTMSNFRALRILLDKGHVLEARVLVRCCLENLFWMAALSKRGGAFVQEVLADDDASTLKQAGRILAWVDETGGEFDFEKTLRPFVREANKTRRKSAGIRHRQAATQGEVQDAYIAYGGLSSDAAHPSATSLARHMGRSPDGKGVSIQLMAANGPNEAMDTLGLACATFLSVCSATAEAIGNTNARPMLPAFIKEYHSLCDSKDTRDTQKP